MKNLRSVVLVLLAVAIVVASGYAFFSHIWPHGPTTIQSPDKMVTLTIPAGAATAGTTAVFKQDPQALDKLNLTMKGVSALGVPVDISPSGGTFAPNTVTVTLRYNPHLPQGISAKNLGIALFDPTFDAWFPIMNSRVDATNHTVSALAPHFSLFSIIALDPAKAVVHVGTKVLKTAITATTTVAEWFGSFFTSLATSFIDDLFGIAPDLECHPASDDITVTTVSSLQDLTGCVERDGNTSSDEETLRIRNGYGYPLLSDPLTGGLKVSLTDVLVNGNNLASLLRSALFLTGHHVEIPGASLGQLTIGKEMQTSATTSFVPDYVGVAMDVFVTFLLVFAPASDLAELAAKEAIQELLTVETLAPGEPGTADAWFGRAVEGFDCLLGRTKAGQKKLSANFADFFGKEEIEQQVDTAKECISSLLTAVNLKLALTDFLSQLKVLPELISGEISGIFQVTLGVDPTVSLTATRESSPLEDVDWTQVVTQKELGCDNPNYGPNHGVEVDAKQFADITGDGKAEAFVAVACVGSTESWPDRLEVFDGASDPAHPQRTAILLDYQDGSDGSSGEGLRIHSITISGKLITVVSRGWTPEECYTCGDQRVTDIFTWNGSSFTRGSRSVVQMT
jgi:hypothetical protein